jgi:hypothetical protein
VVSDATTIKPLMKDNPKVLDVAARMLELYGEITKKALANEQAKGS